MTTGVANARACVQIAVLRAMLTIMSATTVQVHYVVLLLIVRACYNTYIMSRSETTQHTAKAVLTQIANIVFSRLLAGDTVAVQPVSMPDLSAGVTPREPKREAATAQSVVMSVWQSIAPPAPSAAAAAPGNAAFLGQLPEHDAKCVCHAFHARLQTHCTCRQICCSGLVTTKIDMHSPWPPAVYCSAASSA